MDIKVTNILKNREKLSLSKAEDIITNIALLKLTNNEIEAFEKGYTDTLIHYLNEPKLSISSQSFEIGKLPKFLSWQEQLVANKDKYMPLIVAKMMKGDSLAHSIFKEVYNNLGKDELILTYSQFTEEGSPIREAYLNSDGGAGANAILNAEYWLNSDEAKSILCNSDTYNNDLDLLIDGC